MALDFEDKLSEMNIVRYVTWKKADTMFVNLVTDESHQHFECKTRDSIVGKLFDASFAYTITTVSRMGNDDGPYAYVFVLQRSKDGTTNITDRLIEEVAGSLVEG